MLSEYSLAKLEDEGKSLAYIEIFFLFFFVFFSPPLAMTWKPQLPLCNFSEASILCYYPLGLFEESKQGQQQQQPRCFSQGSKGQAVQVWAGSRADVTASSFSRLEPFGTLRNPVTSAFTLILEIWRCISLKWKILALFKLMLVWQVKCHCYSVKCWN